MAQRFSSAALRAPAYASHPRPLLPSFACVRLLATLSKSQPCSAYLERTHPDGDAKPGSTVAETLARFSKSTLATYSRPQLLFTRGQGLDLYSAADPSTNQGKSERKYLDFSSGIAVNSLGHADAQIAQLAHEQSSRLIHASNLYHNEWSGELANRMVELTHQHGGMGIKSGSEPQLGALKVFLANSGTEANEAALKFARKSGKVLEKPGQTKTQLVSFTNAFHGRTMGALSLTPNPKYQAPFAPLIGDVVTGRYNSHEGLDELINENTAGVIVEPVQGEGGIYPASVEWLQAVRKRCDEVGALLIFDEIQCGLFRSGTLWCHSSLPTDAHPDMVTMAKPLANGFPIGAVLMRDSVAKLIAVGDHGTTFGGGPLASRIAHHVLGRLSDPKLVESMKKASEHLFGRLRLAVEMFPDLVHDRPDEGRPSPRGKGLLVGLSMAEPSYAGRVVALARERGLLVLTAGSDAVRIIPSLIVSKEQIDQAVDILESCLLVLRQELAAEKESSSTTKVGAVAAADNLGPSSTSPSLEQKRGYSTQAAAAEQGDSTVRSLYEALIDLGESWPKDDLRPDVHFGKEIISAAKRSLLVRPSSNEETLKRLTEKELDQTRQALEALRAIKGSQVLNEFPLPDKISRPASSPKYYERLLNTLDKAAKGKSVSLGWKERLDMFFGRK
ncbi:acetylornithine and succinylornithine aminotransferase [Violaceomyces palustris]|uniref:Acetylornithine and succinylornithine aminotransferase n=1 Tax=Violaceomyces palustris TaxID=1673888 RepID=A0ACD0NXD4_9BASI|nr:acetylornithine and succinylornithine aminotransferase [Violaceomyces palustris]